MHLRELPVAPAVEGTGLTAASRLVSRGSISSLFNEIAHPESRSSVQRRDFILTPCKHQHLVSHMMGYFTLLPALPHSLLLTKVVHLQVWSTQVCSEFSELSCDFWWNTPKPLNKPLVSCVFTTITSACACALRLLSPLSWTKRPLEHDEIAFPVFVYCLPTSKQQSFHILSAGNWPLLDLPITC